MSNNLYNINQIVEILDKNLIINKNLVVDNKKILYEANDFEQSFDLDEVILRSIYALGTDGSRIYLIKSIGIQKDQNVYLGCYFEPETYFPQDYICDIDIDKVHSDRLKVIKFSELIGRNEEEEINTWNLLISLGITNPDLNDTYTIYNKKVLVMTYMNPIIPEEWKQIGIDILNSLQILHKVGVHNDIKPDNILKHPKTGKYVLMDMEGIAKKDLYYGYLRRFHSPNWTSQSPTNYQITNPKYDLIELGYTLHYLSRDDLPKDKIRIIWTIDKIQFAFLDYCIQLDERMKYLPDNVYEDLRNILRN